MSKTYYGERENSTRQEEETLRFYRQQKSVRAECDYGAKNCSNCTVNDCKIRQFVENY